MSSSFTSNIGLELPANGDYVNDWDQPVNGDFTVIDTIFGGVTRLNAVAASGVIVLTLTQYRPRIIIITGALTSNVNYRFPSGIGGTWAVFNNTSGNFTVTFSSGGGGSTAVLIQGYTTAIICDGTNVGAATNAPINPGGLTTQVQYNNGGILAGSANLTFNGSALGLTGALNLQGSSSGLVGFKAPASAGSTTFTLPFGDGTLGQVLTTNGSATLSWTTVSGGGGSPTGPAGGDLDGSYPNPTVVSINDVTTGILSPVNGGTGTANSGAVSWPSGGGAVTITTATQTLTNKRINPRVSSATTTTMLTINSDSFDSAELTALASSLTVAAPIGTPVDIQPLVIRLDDNGTPQTLTWTTGSTGAFRAVGVVLPTVTTPGTSIYVGCFYNTAASRWDAVAVA